MVEVAQVNSGRARRRAIWRAATLGLCVAAIVGLTIGFVSSVRVVTGTQPPSDVRGEGIVVLTGGAARIDEALRLLADGRAKRLLISGVHPMVTRDVLAGTLPGDLGPALQCCVDLDHRARDTIENAAETRHWAQSLGFRSLIVVTSDYHMPRTMTELAGALPETRLIPFPVSNHGLSLGDWWRDPSVFGLLAREYGKLLLAETRQLFPTSRPARAAAR